MLEYVFDKTICFLENMLSGRAERCHSHFNWRIAVVYYVFQTKQNLSSVCFRAKKVLKYKQFRPACKIISAEKVAIHRKTLYLS